MEEPRTREILTLAQALARQRTMRDKWHLDYVTIQSSNGQLLVLPKSAWESGRGVLPGDRLVCTLLVDPLRPAVLYTDLGWELYHQQEDTDDD